MKANDSSSTLLNIMIPKFQQLLPYETPVSGSWLHSHCTPEPTKKLLSSPMSIPPTSTCADLAEREYPILNLLSSSRKCSSLPSDIKNETIDKSSIDSKPMKQCSNFTIDYLLSDRHRSTNSSNRSVQSIFSKKKRSSFSDRYLHRRISPRKRTFHKKLITSHYPIEPRGVFLSYIFDVYHGLISRQYQMKNEQKIDPLAQLAELACQLDRREKTSMWNEDQFSLQTFDDLVQQCYRLIEQIISKCEHRKERKRLNNYLQLKSKERCLHFSISILNLLQMRKHHRFDQTRSTDCQILMSDISIEKTKMKKTNQSICFFLKPTDIQVHLEILLPNNGLVYEGIIQPIDNYDDLLLVRLKHERQMYLIPIHDLCRVACRKMIPEDFTILTKGLRVCAYWSTSLRGLHPAIVKKIPQEIDESSMVSLAFDDGDTGLIKLDEIRLLPDNYDMKDVNLEEWRVSSFQIPSTISPTTRRTNQRSLSSISQTSHSSLKRISNRERSLTKVPQWTLNLRNSTVIRHDKKQTLHVGDCVILHGVENSLSYIGKVLKFYQNKSTKQDLVRLKWYYSPEETPSGRQENDLPGALYESTHIDENPISTLRYKGTIYASFDEFMKKTDDGRKRKEHDYYLVGHYNPTTGKLQRYENH